MPYSIDPQVAGELGEGTVLDSSVHPPLVTQVDYVLDGPATDDLIQSFPVYLVSVELAERLQRARLTGFALADAAVRPSLEYLAVYGNVAHRQYRWLRLQGTAEDDCWLDGSFKLCVSDRMMRILESAKLSDCVITKIP
jgi:hypothetical protein